MVAVPSSSEKSGWIVGNRREQWKSTKTEPRNREVWGVGEENGELHEKGWMERNYVADRGAEHPGSRGRKSVVVSTAD